MRFQIAALIMAVVICLSGCSSKEKRWGKEFDIEGKWWEQNGQSYDPNTKVFMVAGMSRGNYGSLRLERDSADMDGRKQIANFMQSLVSSYVKECSTNEVDVSENMVKAISKEILVGSAIVARHYDESKKIYYSLLKINLNYFFDRVKDRVLDSSNKTLMERYSGLDPDEKDKMIDTGMEELKEKIAKVEEAVSEKVEGSVKR